MTEPTHILEKLSRFIDLIFTNQQNIVMKSGIHPTLHLKCHQQIIYLELNLKTEYSSPYIRDFWDNNNAEIDLISHSVESFDCSKCFQVKTYTNKLYFLTKQS